MANAKLIFTEDDASQTGGIVLRAPPIPGEHAYRAVVVAAGSEDEVQVICAADFVIVSQAHKTYLSTWDLPSAIPAGDEFTVKIGLRCSSGCNLAGQSLDILDTACGERHAVAIESVPWPLTDALYFGVASIVAPAEAGIHGLQIVTREWDMPVPHTPATLDISVNCVTRADYTITIHVVGYENRTPISGATIVAHPFRAMTDGSGITKLNLPNGNYEVLISAPRHLPSTALLDVSADLEITIELDADETWKSEDEQFGSVS